MRRWAGRPSPYCKLLSPACPRGSTVGTGQRWPDGLNLTAWAEGPPPHPSGKCCGLPALPPAPSGGRPSRSLGGTQALRHKDCVLGVQSAGLRPTHHLSIPVASTLTVDG